MRRFHVTARAQAGAASALALTVGLSAFGSIQAAGLSVTPTGSNAAAVARMHTKLAAIEDEMVTIRHQARAHAERLEQRQAFLDAVLTGKGPVMLPASADAHGHNAVTAPLAAVEGQQDAFVTRALTATDARYRQAATLVGRLGFDARQLSSAMGGPYEPVPAVATPSTTTTGLGRVGQADPQFRALFQSWKRLERIQTAIVAIPSHKPTEYVNFTSSFGVRSDPFRGGAAMHSGVDISGPIGTPIYATADGIVGRAHWANGYGNLVELEHGKGIQTRYGHLSSIAVMPGMRVTRGQLIARMGSTGRSTGSHLHYEVRLDGRAVNPMPFLQSANYLATMQQRLPMAPRYALGGPRE